MTGLLGIPMVWFALLAFVGLLVGIALIARRRSVTVRVPARLDSIRPLSSLLEQMGREAELGEQAVFHCRLALDEACANIIEHSYEDNPNGEIEATIQVTRDSCAIFLTDFGKPYDPARVNDPASGVSIDEMKPGGLGLHLMRNVMDVVHYEPGPRGNRLTMIKHRQPTHSSLRPSS